jgi:hypothetical protein
MAHNRRYALAAVLAIAAVTGCRGEEPKRTERWVTTENTKVSIDWDAVNKAYREAEGPEDFERRVNEIYQGDEVVSVAVRDEGAKVQVVTGFFDRNENGAVDATESIFTIKREIGDDKSGNYQIQGQGMYAGYHSPMLQIASGMLLGSMLANAFSPRPIYYGGYTTPGPRREALRESFAKPGSKASQAGRYGETGRGWGSSRGTSSRGSFGGGRVGGGRFGVRQRRRRIQLAS